MLDPQTLKILENIEGRNILVGEAINIADSLNEIFPFSIPIHEGDARRINGKISNFIISLHDYLDFDEAQEGQRNDPRNNPENWFTIFNVKNTNRAIRALADYRAFKEQSLTNQSVVLANDSVVKTGDSVRETNERIVDISDRQAASNETIATNSRFQTKYMWRQTIALYFTASFALMALIISYKSCNLSQLNYERDISKSQFEQLLKKKDSTIRTLQSRISPVKIASSHRIMAKKISTKK